MNNANNPNQFPNFPRPTEIVGNDKQLFEKTVRANAPFDKRVAINDPTYFMVRHILEDATVVLTVPTMPEAFDDKSEDSLGNTASDELSLAVQTILTESAYEQHIREKRYILNLFDFSAEYDEKEYLINKDTGHKRYVADRSVQGIVRSYPIAHENGLHVFSDERYTEAMATLQKLSDQTIS